MKTLTYHKLHPLGFTIVELIVSMAILTLFMASASLIFLTTFKINAQTGSNLDTSSQTELTVTYFNSDIQSASSFKTTGSPTCTNNPTSDTLVFETNSSTYTSSTTPLQTTYAVSYVYRTQEATPTAPASRVLHRLVCQGPAQGPAQGPFTVTDDSTLSTLSQVQPPVAVCQKANPAKTPVACESSEAIWANMTVTTLADSSYTVTGSRRTS